MKNSKCEGSERRTFSATFAGSPGAAASVAICSVPSGAEAAAVAAAGAAEGASAGLPSLTLTLSLCSRFLPGPSMSFKRTTSPSSPTS